MAEVSIRCQDLSHVPNHHMLFHAINIGQWKDRAASDDGVCFAYLMRARSAAVMETGLRPRLLTAFSD